MISAYIENVHHASDPEVYVYGGWIYNRSSLTLNCHNDYLTRFLIGDLRRSYARSINPLSEREVLSFLGVHQLGGSIVASSSKGQTTYLSLLETLQLDQCSVHSLTVCAGWLQYEGQGYSRILGSGPHELALHTSKILADDFSHKPYEQQPSAENFSWMMSLDDDMIQCYFVPYVGRTISMNIGSTREAIERLWFYEECAQPCAKLSKYKPDLKYCRTVEAALSSTEYRGARS